MAEAIILPIAQSILQKLASFTGNQLLTHATAELKAAKSAKHDLSTIQNILPAICAVLRDADTKQYSSQAIQVWLTDLKSLVYDIDDLLDEVAYDALLRSVNKADFFPQMRYYLSSSNPIFSKFGLSHKIRALREKLDHIVAKKNDLGLTECPVETPCVPRDPFDACAYVNKSAVLGRDEAKHEIMNRLLKGSSDSRLNVLPIVGMGGIGKTTLAKLVYNDAAHFDFKSWVCVSEKFDIKKILEDLIKDATGEVLVNQTLGNLIKKVENLLGGKKFFIVLDDVWVDNYGVWIELKSMLENFSIPDSFILVTTRNANTADITRTLEPFNLDRLPDSVCRSIFEQLAFQDGEEAKRKRLCEIGRSIVRKCGGVPLVVKCLGSLLRSERDEGEWVRINNLDTFTKLQGQYDHVMQLLKLSYDKLPTHVKSCFCYLALYPKNTLYVPWYQTYCWSALGLLPSSDGSVDIEGFEHRYFTEFLSRSMIHDLEWTVNDKIAECKIHDLLHDLAMNVLGDELAVVKKNGLNVSESTRHIVWEYEGTEGVSFEEFPEKLAIAKKARTFRITYQRNRLSKSFLEGVISSLSCLRILDLKDNEFEELPRSVGDLKHLRLLRLSNNPLIKTLPTTICELLNLQALHLKGCKQLQELPTKIYRLINLRCFSMSTRQSSLMGPKINRLRSVRDLWLESCMELVSLWDNDDVGSLTSLRRLYVLNCPRLTSLPNSMKLLVSLEVLVIKNCQELTLDNCDGLSGLQSLRLLSIMELPHLTCLPNGIQSAANSLQYLWIGGFEGLTELPEWLRLFTTLKKMIINNCPNLLGLTKGIRHLKALQKLHIRNCPHVTKRCAVSSGEDYALIQHIPLIILDGIEYQH